MRLRTFFCCTCYVTLLFLLSSGAFGADTEPPEAREPLNGEPSQSQATDTIRLKNGSILHGLVVRFENGIFTIVIPGTQSRAMVHVNDVERIEFAEGASASTTQAVQVTPASVRREEIKSPPSSPSRQDTAQMQGGKTTPPPTQGSEKTRGTPTPTSSQLPESKPAVATETPANSTIPAVQKNPTAQIPSFREATVSVAGREIWGDSGLEVSRGDRLRVSASGRINLARNQSTGPEGVSISDPGKMMPTRPTGGLIAVIGDDNDDFFFIGAAAEFVAQRSGRLFLMVNENNVDDNSGAFTVRIQVQSPPGP